MKQKYLLYVLLTSLLLYYAMPYLQPFYGGTLGLFSLVWILFALLVLSGNFLAFLSAPKGEKKLKVKTAKAPLKRRMYQ
ncbi:hypothetical protein M1E11_20530 [Bacillus sp. JZ8]